MSLIGFGIIVRKAPADLCLVDPVSDLWSLFSNLDLPQVGFNPAVGTSQR